MKGFDPRTSLLLPLQFTEEKFGQAEKTELDAHFENLLARADSTKNWTERILRQTEVLLQPNPSEWVWGRGRWAPVRLRTTGTGLRDALWTREKARLARGAERLK